MYKKWWKTKGEFVIFRQIKWERSKEQNKNKKKQKIRNEEKKEYV